MTAQTAQTMPPGPRLGPQDDRRSGVKATLRPARRARPSVENDEFASFARRVIAAHGRRVACGDVDALADLIALSAQVDAALQEAVSGLRAFGYSWARIAAGIGTSRQAAQQRWGTGHPGDPT